MAITKKPRDSSVLTAYEKIARAAVRLTLAFRTLRNSSEPAPIKRTLYPPQRKSVATQSNGSIRLRTAYSLVK